MSEPEKKRAYQSVARAAPLKETAADASAAIELLERKSDKPPPPEIVIVERDGGNQIDFAGDDLDLALLRLQAATGARNSDAALMLLEQLANLSAKDIEKMQPRQLNQALAMLSELDPADGAEGMLAAQMVAVHVTTMNCLKRANIESQTFHGRELNLKFATKLSRLFAQQMEAMGKHRRKGTQKVTVEHVHVHDGGQAIVGSVGHGD